MVPTDFYGIVRILLAVLICVGTAAGNESILCNGIRTIHSNPSKHSDHDHGYITSPNHPKSYPAEVMQCTFKFQPKADEQVQLTFSYFNLRESQKIPANVNCDLSDSVKIVIGTRRNHADADSQVGEYCGKRHPEIVMSVGRPLTVIFTVRARENPQISSTYMFKAKYTFTKHYGLKGRGAQNTSAAAGCHFIFDGRRVGGSGRGDFDSPNFGGLYPFNTNCLYTFQAFGNQSIRLNFDKFEVEGTHDCRRAEDDFLYIKEGNQINWQSIATDAENDAVKRDTNTTLYCGLRRPPTVETRNQVVHVVFKSGQSMTKHGFKGTYTFLGHPGVYLSGGSITDSSNWSAAVTFLSLFVLATAQLFAV